MSQVELPKAHEIDTGFGVLIAPVVPEGAPEPVWELATMFPPQGAWSAERYLELTDNTNRPIEFIDGRLEFLAIPSRTHERIARFLFLLLIKFVDGRQLGEVFYSGMRVSTASDADAFRLPDILFLKDENEAEWGGERFLKGVDLAIEVVSPDEKSRHRDYVEKRVEYAQAGISEYWIVDPQAEKITVLSLPAGAKEYAEHGVFKPGETAGSKLLDGLAVDAKACFDAGKV